VVFSRLDTSGKFLDAISIQLILHEQIDQFRLQKDATFDHEDSAPTGGAQWAAESNSLNSERIYSSINGYRDRITSDAHHD